MFTPEAVTAVRRHHIIPLGEVDKDWRKVSLANQLLGIGLAVYRNSVSLSNCPAGSFIIPLENQPVSRERVSALTSERAKRCGMVTIFSEEAITASQLKRLVRPKVAVLYDTGQKYALMALSALETMGFYAEALSAEDISNGALGYANVLVIPGGIHTDKAARFGHEGEARVKEFARRGGGVLAIGGGAVLAAQVEGGWGITAATREPGKVSKTMHGPIWINPGVSDHPLWYGYPAKGFPLANWYGRAFQLLSDEVRVLGKYGRPTADFYIDHELTGSYFGEYLPEEMATLDRVYDGMADPENLSGLAAIAEGKYGDGKIIASYLHPETPGFEESFLMLANAIFYLAERPPFAEHTWPELSDERPEPHWGVLSALAGIKECHSSLVAPVVKELVSFGERNLYWITRPHIPWCYIGKGKYPFYVCEQLEAYTDEITRQLNELPPLISEINTKFEKLSAWGDRRRTDESLKQMAVWLHHIYHRGTPALSQTLTAYHAKIQPEFSDWATSYKKILLYRHLLSMMKAEKADPDLVEDVSRKSRKLTEETLGGWRWVQASKKYRDIFTTLDTASYHLANLKNELRNISLQLDRLWLIGG